MTPWIILFHFKAKHTGNLQGNHAELRYLGQLLDGEEALHAMEMGVKALQRSCDQQKVRMGVLPPTITKRRTGWLDHCMLVRHVVVPLVGETIYKAGICDEKMFRIARSNFR